MIFDNLKFDPLQMLAGHLGFCGFFDPVSFAILSFAH